MRIRVLTFCFRKLPNYFDVWLKSAAMNPEIDFLVVTMDDTKYELPKNVVIQHGTFDEVMNKVKTVFSCPIDIRDPYKFCDLRPMFGYIFSEWFEGYDFWGGCDLDVVFGDIRKFITDDVLEKFDKILTRDHFYLYRNTEEVNSRFMLSVHGNDEMYKQVLGDHLLYCFGERKPWGMYRLYQEHGFDMFDEPIVADVFYKEKPFCIGGENLSKKGQIFLWENGKLYLQYITENNEVGQKEYMYVHLQKRPMEISEEMGERFIIVSNRFVNQTTEVTADIIKHNSKKPLVYDVMVKQFLNQLRKPINTIFYQE